MLEDSVELQEESLFRLLQVQTHQCRKRLYPCEGTYHDRFIWLNESTKEFHWSKVSDNTSSSKFVNLVTHVTGVELNAVPDAPIPNFRIDLNPSAIEFVFTKGYLVALKTAPTSIDICMDGGDATICAGFVKLIRLLMYEHRTNPAHFSLQPS